jgi:hypothetical protein
MASEYGWKGKKVKHGDGREGSIIREYADFDYISCTIRLTDGNETSFLLSSSGNRDTEGWSWYAEDGAGSGRWLEFTA